MKRPRLPKRRQIWPSTNEAKLEFWAVTKLKPSPNNARTHNRKQRRKLASSIRRLGFRDPIIVDECGFILAGHLRHQAAIELGLTTVPVIQIKDLSENDKRLYALAANRIALDAGWDRRLLAVELGDLVEYLADEGIELEATGFEISEIDTILQDHGEGESKGLTAGDELAPPGVRVTRLGDLWNLGQQKLLCADARLPASFSRLMGRKLAVVVIADVPYNVSIGKHARRKSGHREFAMASGEMSSDEFRAFLIEVLREVSAVMKLGGIAFTFIDWRHVVELTEAGVEVFGELKNMCVWVKSNGGMGTFYRSQHELVLVFKNGDGPHINTFELGQHGRSRTNVWHYSGVNSFKKGRREELDLHPTVKPVALIADALLDCSSPGALVLDPFMGSGTTLIAAEKVGRVAYGLELDPQYVDVAVRRWQLFTGKDAILDGTGETFEEVAERRNPMPATDRNASSASRKTPAPKAARGQAAQ